MNEKYGKDFNREVFTTDDLKLEKVTESMSEAEKIDVMRSNLLKILKSEISTFKKYEEQFFLSNKYKEAANPMDPKHKEAYEYVEQAAIERDILNRLNGTEDEIVMPVIKGRPNLTSIDKYIIVNQNKELEQLIKKNVYSDYLDNYDLKDEMVVQ
jgi:hypothetical protein